MAHGKKFDVVIMNPPYQATSEGGADPLSNRLSGKRDLYDKFIEMADQLADTWALVSPCFWLGRPNHKLYKLVMPKVSYVIKTTEWFKSVAGVETAAFVCNPNPSDHVTLVHSGSDVTLPRSDVRGFVSSDVHGILTRLRKSGLVGMDTIHFQSNEFVRSKINASPSGTYSYVDITGASDQVDPVYLKSVTPLIQKHTGKSRLVCNWNGSTTSIGAIKHIADKNAAISASCVALVCGSDTEASNLRQVLMSKLYRFVVANVKTSATNNKATFKELPLVDLTRSWTDAELYAHFNLTQEEIDLIEATVK